MKIVQGDEPGGEQLTRGGQAIHKVCHSRPAENSEFVWEKNGFVFYPCKPGYHKVSGNELRMCTRIGPIGVPPNCVKECHAKPGQNSEPERRQLKPGTSVRYTCEPGYRKANGSVRRRCTKTGRLKGSPLNCEIATTGCYAEPGRNSEPERLHLKPRTSVRYTCKPGYRKANGSSSRRCTRTSRLTGSPLNCEIATTGCYAEPGRNSEPERLHLKPRTSVRYTCKPGYHKANGSSSRRCTRTSRLTGSPLNCMKDWIGSWFRRP